MLLITCLCVWIGISEFLGEKGILVIFRPTSKILPRITYELSGKSIMNCTNLAHYWSINR